MVAPPVPFSFSSSRFIYRPISDTDRPHASCLRQCLRPWFQTYFSHWRNTAILLADQHWENSDWAWCIASRAIDAQRKIKICSMFSISPSCLSSRSIRHITRVRIKVCLKTRAQTWKQETTLHTSMFEDSSRSRVTIQAGQSEYLSSVSKDYSSRKDPLSHWPSSWKNLPMKVKLDVWWDQVTQKIHTPHPHPHPHPSLTGVLWQEKID